MADDSKTHRTKPRNDLTAEYVRSILDYDPDTGIFRWKFRADYPHGWNVKHVAKQAGHQNKKGYIQIGIGGYLYLGSRLAWLYVTGSWPEQHVDHKNGRPFDNSFTNLREADDSQNVGCGRKRLANKSGYTGVHRVKNRWRAVIVFQRKTIHLGYFNTPEKANDVYRMKAMELRGEFSNQPVH